MKVHIDLEILDLQAFGGIRNYWLNVIPFLRETPGLEITGGPNCPPDADWFVPTYYQRAPDGIKSLVVVYDMIAERYAQIGANNPDAIKKRLAIKEATRVVAISGHVAADVMKYTRRVVDAVAMPGVSRSYLQGMATPNGGELTRRHSTDDHPYVLVVGRRGLYKNVQTLYHAWKYFNGRDDHKILCVGGEPTQWFDAAFDAAYPGVRKHIPAWDDTTLANAYAGASMLVYPSALEGFGIPPLEAYAMNCEVVCGPCMLEILRACAQIALDVYSPKSIAAAMNSALVNKVPEADKYRLIELYPWQSTATVLTNTVQMEKDLT